MRVSLHPDDDQRCDRDDRRHLQQDRVGEEARLDPAALHEQQRDRGADQRGGGQRGERDADGDAERVEQQRAVGDERLRDPQRRGHQVRRHVPGDDQRLPGRSATSATASGAAQRSQRASLRLIGRTSGPDGCTVRPADRASPPRRPPCAGASSASAPAAATQADSRRACAANAGEWRNASSRGYGSSIATSASTRPGRAPMTTTRVDRNTASAMLCVTKTTVSPRPAHSASSSPSSRCRVNSSSAPNGSSISSRSGAVTSARAIDARICMPPDSSRGKWRAKSAQTHAARARRRPRRRPGRAERRRGRAAGARWRRRAPTASASAPGTRTRADGRGRRSRRSRRPTTTAYPVVGAARPATRFSSVDLPQPDGPSSVTNSPPG